MRKDIVLLALGLLYAIAGHGQPVNKNTEPINIGGADIYLQETKGFFAKYKKKKILKYHREGDTNVIVYNGMTVRYPDQTVVKYGKSIFPAKIYTYEGRTEIVLNGAVVIGSEGNDNVVIYCTNSTFDFSGGDTDTVCLKKKLALDNDGPQMLGNAVQIGEGDQLLNIIDYTYNNELVIIGTECFTVEDNEYVYIGGWMEYLDFGTFESKKVRIKNREISLDEDEWEDGDF